MEAIVSPSLIVDIENCDLKYWNSCQDPRSESPTVTWRKPRDQEAHLCWFWDLINFWGGTNWNTENLISSQRSLGGSFQALRITKRIPMPPPITHPLLLPWTTDCRFTRVEEAVADREGERNVHHYQQFISLTNSLNSLLLGSLLSGVALSLHPVSSDTLVIC